jgi:hypothetical protein
MLSVAMVAALIRFALEPLSEQFRGYALRSLTVSGGICIGVGVAACAAAWASLGKGHPAVRLPIVVAVVAFTVLLVCGPLGAEPVVVFATLVGVMVPSVTGSAMLPLRLAGFRLVGPRSRGANNDVYLKRLSECI